MKSLMILTVGVCLFLTAVPVVADQAADETAIRQAMEQMNAAWNKHQSAPELTAEDYENWSGSLKGRAANNKYWSDYYAREQAKDLRYKLLDEIGIIFVTPDVAIYKSRCETTGRLDDSGKSLPSRKWLGAWVLVKKNDKWLATALFSRPIQE